MCGICGVIQIHGEARRVVPDDVLDRMTDAMAHRGPNDRGTHVSPGASIGARRLSIIDVEGGHQPFSNEDGTIWAVQNGELYNHASIRDDLRRRGHRFASRCDTEILPHLYEEYGPMFPEQLRGMFGIAVWDQARRRGVDRARPARDQADLLRRLRRLARLRLRAQEPARQRARPDATSTTRRSTRS